MAVPYEVQTFHLNVGIGESTVVCLHESVVRSSKKLPVLHKIVLIDGGFPSWFHSSRAAAVIRQFLTVFLSSLFDSEGYPGGIFVLDTVVITHWDRDHYGGIASLLVDALTPNVIHPSPTRCDLFKYDPMSGEPSTYMYVPYMTKSGKQGAPDHMFQKSDGTTDRLKFNISTTSVPIWVMNICHLRYGADQVMGVNFFTNTQHPDTLHGFPRRRRKVGRSDIVPVTVFDTPAQFINGFPDADIHDGDPGLFCVGCNNFVFQAPAHVEPFVADNIAIPTSTAIPSITRSLAPTHPTNDESPNSFKDEIAQATSTPFPPHRPNVFIIDNPVSATKGEETNSASIMTILAWKNTSPTRVSHYLAGDALWQQETALVNWLALSCDVANVKISHHGAAKSSPVTLFQGLNPITAIVSAGTEHGHPRWELLLWLYGWRLASNLGARFTGLVPICYPYYLVLDQEKNPYTHYRFSVDALDRVPTGSRSKELISFQAYQAALSALPEFSAPNEPTFVSVFQDATAGLKDVRRKRGIIQRFLSKAWPVLSEDVGGKFHPFQDGNHTIYYIWVYSSRTGELVKPIPRGSIAPYPGKGMSSTSKHPKHKESPKPLTISLRSRSKRALTQAEDEPVDEPQAAKWTKVDTSVLDAAALADADNEDSNEGDDGDEMPVDQAPFVLLADPLAAAPASLAPPDPPEPLPTFGYYICASDEVVIAASNVISLPRSDPLNSFFQDLHDGFLAFETIPDATGVKLLNKADFADEVGDWFVRGFGADVVTAKRLGIDFLSALSIGFSKPLPMMFSTEAIKLSFDWDASKPLPPCGYITSQKSMIFGLDPKTLPTPTTQLSLGGILEFLDLPGDHLLALNVTAGLILDTSTVPANRNAIWFSPWNNYETVLRLQFKLADEGALTSFITNNISSKIQIVTPRVIVRKRMSWFHNSDGFECIPDPQIIFSVSIKRDNGSHIDTILTFDMGIVTLTMRPNGTLVDFLDWMADLAGADKAEVGTINQWVGKVSSHLPTVLELRIQANSFGLQAFYVVMELEVELGKADGQSENVVFLITYRWSAQAPHHELNGSIWCPVTLTTHERVLPLDFDPTYEALLAPVQPTVLKLTPFLRLTSLFPNTRLQNVPAEVDLGIFSANIMITSDSMRFEGVLIQDPSRAPSSFSISLGKIDIGGSYQFSSSSSSRPYDICLSASINIVGQTPDDTATILAAITYNNTSESWNLSGRIEDLKMTTLLQFFPQTDAAVMDIMGHLEVEALHIDYRYGGVGKGETPGVGNFFHVSGTLLIDVFELDMLFERDATKSWHLSAQLGLAGPSQPTTIDQLLNTLVGDTTITSLIPSFAKFDISAGGGTGLSLIVTKSTAVDGFIVFILSLKLQGDANAPSLSLNFIQIKSTDSSKKPPTKRVIRVSVESIPFTQIPSIPLVGSIKQPFKEMDYVWVHDDTGVGLTQQELDCINTIPDFSGIKYKQLFVDHKPEHILLVPGSHFLVSADDTGSPSGSTVILDYAFGRPEKDSVVKAAAVHTMHLAAASPDMPQGDTAMAKLQKTQGPLTIENFGLRYSGSTLSILFDATVKLGPIEFVLLGFGFSLTFGKDVSLRSLSNITPSLDLSGLAIEFKDPPVEIAGIFEKVDSNKYVGGVVLGMDPYSFTAVGSYGEITDKTTGHSYKSVFVFCQLEGPLIELEFAEIQGITAAFGYNSSLRYPTIDEVDQFPFIGGSLGSPGSDPLDLLVKLTDATQPPKPGTGWITPREGPLWLAAGLEVKAFQTLTVQAVVVLEFNPYVSLGIFAKAVAAIPAPPSGAPSSEGAFVYAEIGIVSSVDFQAGTMFVQAKLSPNSFILNPACHLTGGFALCQWFGTSPHAGDWVFTVGGYHPAYLPPPHYPSVDRLAISWNLGGGLSVTGQAYFAITPKVCMGGGALAVVLNIGALSAYFRAHADFLITYSPFHFVGDVGVSVGVEFTLDLWICTIHINVDIGAQLHLQGPPFSGYVYVDFWVFGFTVYFGHSDNSNDPIDLPAFWQLLLQQPGDTPITTEIPAVTSLPLAVTGPTNTPATIQQVDHAHVFAVEAGRSPGKSKTESMETKPGALWVVRPQGFRFRVQSLFAIGAASCNEHSPVAFPTSIYAKPMQLVAGNGSNDGSILSNLTIKVDFVEKLGVFKCDPVVKKVPKALWGAYLKDEDPQTKGFSIRNVLRADDITIELMMGVTVTAPPPYISKDPLPPFDALAAMSESIYPSEDHFTPELPSSLTPSAAKWAPEVLADTNGHPEAPWTAVRDAWGHPVDAADGYDLATAVVAWAKTLTWLAVPAGKPPIQLLVDIEKYYLSAPFVGQVA